MKIGRSYGKPILGFYAVFIPMLAVALVIALATPAHSDEYSPEVQWGLIGEPVVIQVQGPRDAWGGRKVTEYIDSQLTGITFRYGPCSERPVWAYCLTFEKSEHGYTRWVGMTTFTGVDQIVVNFNTTYITPDNPLRIIRRGIACHEVLHALGMPHHLGEGCLAQREQRFPSVSEMDALRAFYN